MSQFCASRRFLASLIAATFLVCPLSADEKKPPSGDKSDQKAAKLAARIEKLIRELGDPSFQVRDNAEAALKKIGKPAWEAVLKATRSDNAEVSTRAARVLKKIRVHVRHFQYVDLQPKANVSLDDDWHGYEDNNLKELPKKEQVLGEVKFKVGKKMVQLASTRAPEWPEKVEGIEVGRKCTHIHFLHGTGWGSPSSVEDGTHIGSYRINYADGTFEELPIDYGDDVRDWWNWDGNRETKRARIVWEGKNPALKEFADSGVTNIRLYHRAWKNPKPDVKIKNIDFRSTNETICAPFLVAVTLEDADKGPKESKKESKVE